ncbi:hypothetical protein CSOJ01_11255 [Colletotrichum sojae]|uniref:DUF7791 domain-containing protein n=1 Tax=Colletotrichum sojae TaxID=2175907 RepID=A0A8H6IY32_9PEZI|nr:hypothetical protein CSOJ01_11255 [Colletotrichum sojae]
MERRLRSRTAGLLETIRRNWKDDLTTGNCFCDGAVSHDPSIDGKIDFLYRTVCEFLCQDYIWQLNSFTVSHKQFNTATALSLAGLHLSIQCAIPETSSISRTSSYLPEGVLWGQKADEEVPGLTDNILWHTQPLLDMV